MRIRTTTLMGIFIVAMFAVVGIVGWFTQTPRGQAIQKQQEKRAQVQEMADAQEVSKTLGNRLEYFQDTRTGLCYAYLWGGAQGYGGPAISNVSCSAEVISLSKKGVRQYHY